MKVWFWIIELGMIFSACQVDKKMADPRISFISTVPVDVTIRKTIQDSIVIEEKYQPVDARKVAKMSEEEISYCIVVGSFKDERNALFLRNDLMRQGFFGVSVQCSPEGMFRVTTACHDSYIEASLEVCRIRRQYPQFREAWLLEEKRRCQKSKF